MSIFDSSKSILVSKTFWGALVTVIVVLFPNSLHFLTYVGITPDQFVEKVIVVLSGIFTIYGRISAKTTVTLP